ncbi:hypothetical protein [Loigolactobacillus backii]|uniref:hypothetical protein n=1 Tax=Loigolactobacillus backii TaxID=375175 RepID=UPI0022FD98B0|nr:hypothetical protein [Loigolactobacillus backii]MDA5386987.1 hypothetical protein [Loigolactobacillus backii]MDA5389525.1 hypothetical protein [Loigolactobacillus backii]
MGLFGNGSNKFEVQTVGAIPDGYQSVGLVMGFKMIYKISIVNEKNLRNATQAALDDLASNLKAVNADGYANLKINQVSAGQDNVDLGVTVYADAIKRI